MSANFNREGRIEPFSMPEAKDTHGAWKSKGVGYKTKEVFEKKLTENNYVDSLVFDMRLFSTVLVHIKEWGVNAIKYNVLACIDPSQWETLFSAQVLTTGLTGKQTITEKWNYLKVQVASNVADTHGIVSVFVNGKTP